MDPSPRGSVQRYGAVLALIVVTVAVVLVAQRTLHLPGWLNPFAETTKDRSGPALLESIRDLSRYEAAGGDFQVIVDLEKDSKYLPSAIRGTRTLFVGSGSVNAYVDFSKLNSGAVRVSEDRKTATIVLPHAQLDRASLDPKASYAVSTSRGLTNRLGDALSGNPNNQQQLYVLAAQKIQDAAARSGLQAHADRNTRSMLVNMLGALGFTSVTVQVGAVR
ncbi:hypothetical protein BTM25_38200 [Actinomadura rubteroloni]|uniref:DUF4230 domain-containing protein n=1 Tax=Actinomadura rubteroloni TaxID=1926885 RepID=A0A2P4UJE8_9ACTN|nr:DUF4230 domain-containing protein [Actinomadura rubteroloni]POM25177.1 hypothetical protein BTM25_38200 [Actinomadura rubteroloni]